MKGEPELNSRWIRFFLIKTYGNKCSRCKLEKWNDLPIPLELEHIDGNYTNNNLGNVCLLCPNCHAQTSTYKAKNKGKGRTLRNRLD